jgi:hypothetical protein
MTAEKTATLSLRVGAETLCLLQREAGRIRVPVGAYVRHVLEGHVRALLRDTRTAKGENSVAAHGHPEEGGGTTMTTGDGPRTETAEGTTGGEGAKAENSDEGTDDGRPIYRLVYDPGQDYHWTAGPYKCAVGLVRRRGDGGEEVELRVKFFNFDGNSRDEWGNLAMCTSICISSSLRGWESVPSASTYEEAVEAINAHKARAEEFLRCHLDLSALAGGEEFFPR